jgi:tRNA U34 5-carboxymethylaminomethyl modifying enzyme MnmG/GidA
VLRRYIRFAELATKKLQRGTHRSVRDLNKDIRTWIQTCNDNPWPYVWTMTTDQVLESVTCHCTGVNESRHQ